MSFAVNGGTQLLDLRTARVRPLFIERSTATASGEAETAAETASTSTTASATTGVVAHEAKSTVPASNDELSSPATQSDEDGIELRSSFSATATEASLAAAAAEKAAVAVTVAAEIAARQAEQARERDEFDKHWIALRHQAANFRFLAGTLAPMFGRHTFALFDYGFGDRDHV